MCQIGSIADMGNCHNASKSKCFDFERITTIDYQITLICYLIDPINLTKSVNVMEQVKIIMKKNIKLRIKKSIIYANICILYNAWHGTVSSLIYHALFMIK